jgi:glutaredoxin
MAKAYLKEKGLAYTEFDVAENMEKRQEMVKRSGQMGVPVIIIGNDILVGFNEEKVAGLLGL